MKYSEAIGRLYRFESRGIRLGLERMRDGLLYRGSPERGMPYIHVAGTNGKGSAATMIAACLQAAGYRTGLFTSPHLHRFVERIRIDGRPITEREAARRIADALSAFEAPGAPDISFFETANLMAIEAFRDHGCDVAVLEVGLGGRLDSTNAVPSVLSLITRVALDHTRVLGNSTAAIAREKAGILRRGVPLVVGRCDADARRAIAARAGGLRAPIAWIDRDFRWQSANGRARFEVEVGSSRVTDLRLRLLGAHQRDNAACAVAGLHALQQRGFEIPDGAIRRGLYGVRWPGRLERIGGRPAFVLDAAHNADGCHALAGYLAQQRLRRGRRALVFGVMADKDYPAMLASLGPLCDPVYYVKPNMPRGASPEQLLQAHPGVCTSSVTEALCKARRAAGQDGCVVVAGSIFVVADARAQLLRVRTEPFVRL